MEICPACLHEKSRAIGVKDNFHLLTCLKCKSLYAVQNAGEKEFFPYDEYYDENNLEVPEFVLQRLGEIIAGFAPYRKNGRLLDVGTGAGTFLLAADKAGWSAEGIEVSKPAVDHLRAKNLKMFHGTLHEAAYADDYFDVVVASEVLEHVTEPKALVEEIARILRPGGLFWGTTPHGKGISAKIIGTDWSIVSPPEHLQLFSVSGIREMFEKAGFSRVKIATHGVNPFEIASFMRKKFSKNASPADTEKNFNRVETGYELNESLTSSPARKLLKNSLNSMLNLTRLGDSLKIWAVK